VDCGLTFCTELFHGDVDLMMHWASSRQVN
jgi:hypothetical protein